MAETYAIVESGGKQYRAEKGAALVVDRLSAEEGDKVNLRAVMFRGDGDVVVAGGDLEKVKVEAKVAEHLRGEKIRIFKYKPKKGYRRRAGYRSELTRLEVTEVKMLSRKPAAKSESKSKSEAKPKAAEEPAQKPPAKTESTAKSKSRKPDKKPAAKAQAAEKPKAKAPAKKAGTGKGAAKSKQKGG